MLYAGRQTTQLEVSQQPATDPINKYKYFLFCPPFISTSVWLNVSKIILNTSVIIITRHWVLTTVDFFFLYGVRDTRQTTRGRRLSVHSFRSPISMYVSKHNVCGSATRVRRDGWFPRVQKLGLRLNSLNNSIKHK